MLFQRVTRSLRFGIFFSFLGALLAALIFITVAVEVFVVPSIDAKARQELANSTHLLTSSIQTGASVAVRNHLKAIAEKNLEIVRYHFTLVKQNRLSREDAISRIRAILLSQRIGSSGYIYCVNSQGVAVIHPDPSVEGTDNTRFAFVREQMMRKEGYVEYEWQNPGEQSTRQKALYMVYFEPLDWIISVSSYKAEFIELVDINDFRDAVLSLRFGESGYAYILNKDGETLVHPKLSHYNALSQNDLPSDFVQTMLDTGVGSLEYQWRNPDEIASRKKIAVYENIPEYGWIVVCTSYLQEVMKSVKTTQKIVYFTATIFLITAVFVSYFLSGRLTRPIAAMIQQLDKNARNKAHEPLPVSTDNELGRLATEFNTFLGVIEAKNEELEQERELYRSLFETSPDAVFLLRGVTIIDCNSATVSIFASNKQSLIGTTVIDLSPSFQRDGSSTQDLTDTLIREVATNNILQTFEWIHQRVDGQLFDAEVRLKPFGTEKGEPLLVAFVRDITEQKKLEAVLQQAQKMEAIGTLAGGIAHDFNNILMGILGRVSLLLVTSNQDLSGKEHLRSIEKYVQSAAGLTQQLLGFARGGKYQPKPADLNELIVESSEMFGRTKKEIQFYLNIADFPVVSEIDRQQIEQVLLNIYVNAWQAMPGGGTLHVRSSVETLDEMFCKSCQAIPGKYAKISVTDSGIGMDEATQQRIFDPFFTTKEKSRGTGLGLASAYGIVNNHGGFIAVYSELGHGSTFNVYLPLSSKASAVDALKVTAMLKGSESILLVDDEQMIAEVAQAMLHELGYKVTVAGSGTKAIEIIKKREIHIDLVILDLIMPGLDGGSTFDSIRELQPSLPVILSSGYSVDGQATDILQRGCNGFIQKPFNLSELSQKIRQVIDS